MKKNHDQREIIHLNGRKGKRLVFLLICVVLSLDLKFYFGVFFFQALYLFHQ